MQPYDGVRGRAARAPALAELQKTLADAGVTFLQTHVPDMSGYLRTKIGPFKLNAGEAVNACLLCTTPGEGAPLGEPLFESPWASDDNGYPNMRALADPASVRVHGWKPDWASVLLDSFTIDGARSPIDMRAALATQEARATRMGITVRVAIEFEFGLFHADQALMRDRDYARLQPWGAGHTNYSIARSAGFTPFFTGLISRLQSLDIGATSVTTEYGDGMYELALPPKTPLAAADDAVRFRQVLQEYAVEQGLVATFMARFQPPGRESACGAHHHQSLWRGGENITCTGPRTLSQEARHYLAGLLAYLPETHLIFRPTVNSYRRFDKGAWSPIDTSWRFEDRTAAVRTIGIPDQSASRLEHRAPGADINPYLTITAMLGAGLTGLERRLELGKAAPQPLPATLQSSIAAFRDSQIVADIFGPELAAHHLARCENEVDAFERWSAGHITTFEWQRYFAAL